MPALSEKYCVATSLAREPISAISRNPARLTSSVWGDCVIETNRSSVS